MIINNTFVILHCFNYKVHWCDHDDQEHLPYCFLIYIRIPEVELDTKKAKSILNFESFIELQQLQKVTNFSFSIVKTMTQIELFLMVIRYRNCNTTQSWLRLDWLRSSERGRKFVAGSEPELVLGPSVPLPSRPALITQVNKWEQTNQLKHTHCLFVWILHCLNSLPTDALKAFQSSRLKKSVISFNKGRL